MTQPKDLKHPFSWEQRRVLMQDRILFVPSGLTNDPFQFPGWEHPEVFGNDLPVRIEYCSGNGEWIAKKASEEPQTNWVAIEKRFDRLRLIWAKIKKHNLSNLFAVCGEGYQVTEQYFQKSSVQEVFINFPDPWPKRRHSKHRLMKQTFIEQLSRILIPKGTLTVVTDDVDYSENMIKMMQGQTLFLPTHSFPHYTTHFQDYGSSFFDQLWREKGKEIRYHLYQNQGELR